MELFNLKPAQGSVKTSKRVGRGHGSGHGTTATRGTKGQRARGGGKQGLKRRSMRQILLRIPKLRGQKSIHAKALVVNVDALNASFDAGETVTPVALANKKLIKPNQGKSSVVKILGKGALSKQLTVEGCEVSESARKKIEEVKGTVR